MPRHGRVGLVVGAELLIGIYERNVGATILMSVLSMWLHMLHMGQHV